MTGHVSRHTKRLSLLGLVTAMSLVFSGCASLQWANVSIPRSELALTYADIREEVGAIKVVYGIACRDDPEPAFCQRARLAYPKLQALDLRARELLKSGGGPTPADLSEFRAVAREALGPLLLRMLPLAVP